VWHAKTLEAHPRQLTTELLSSIDFDQTGRTPAGVEPSAQRVLRWHGPDPPVARWIGPLEDPARASSRRISIPACAPHRRRRCVSVPCWPLASLPASAMIIGMLLTSGRALGNGRRKRQNRGGSSAPCGSAAGLSGRSRVTALGDLGDGSARATSALQESPTSEKRRLPDQCGHPARPVASAFLVLRHGLGSGWLFCVASALHQGTWAGPGSRR